MNPKERFESTCQHRNPDRFPIDYQAKRDADQMLKMHFGVSTERELLDELGCDLYYLSARDISQNEAFLPIYRGPKLPVNENERTCPFGIRYQRSAYDWKFGADEVLAGPLETAETPQEVLKHPWPKPEWFDVEALIPECEENAGRVIVSGFWTAIFGNDFGSQNGLLFSRGMWREFYFENYKKLIGLAHRYGLKVMVHSCGSVRGIMKDLIEAGVDILDPVQTTADEMEPEGLKRVFGVDLVFHGAVDTQGVLPRASQEGVVCHVREVMRVLGRDGGYIFAPCNAIQADTPPENVEAMYRTAREYRTGIDS
ncbi:MAG: hypothetical protein JSV89_12115 [Spirochaetaceae bacterium]|nr:MAG: hypothetical protein JSV89_12115 [Spirochaetaceae bacterium]